LPVFPKTNAKIASKNSPPTEAIISVSRVFRLGSRSGQFSKEHNLNIIILKVARSSETPTTIASALPITGELGIGLSGESEPEGLARYPIGDGVAVDRVPPSGSMALREEAIDRMPLAELLTIDPASLTVA
jgi:hypothetical protein